MRLGKLRMYQCLNQSSSPSFLRPGDVVSTTGNCYLTAVSTAIGSLGELLWRHIVLSTQMVSFVLHLHRHFLKTVHA